MLSKRPRRSARFEESIKPNNSDYLDFLPFFSSKIIVNRVILYILVIIRFFSMAPCKTVYIVLSGLPWIKKLK